MKLKVFCFPYAGGNRYSYNAYKKFATPNIELIFIDYPGHGMRMQQRLLKNLHSIADDVILHHGAQFNHHFAFYGHSMGSLVAYLVCKKLQQSGREMPGHLFLTGCGAPASKERFKYRHLLPYAGFITTLREMGGVPEELLEDADSMRFFEPILRADFEAVDTYSYQTPVPFHIPMTVVTGTEEDLSSEEITAWQQETTAGCNFAQMRGGHFFIQQDVPGIMRMLIHALSKTYNLALAS